jgi:hypothetical protein
VALALEEAQARGFRTFDVPFGAHPRPIAALAEAVANTFATLDSHRAIEDARAIAAGTTPATGENLARILAARADADTMPVALGAGGMLEGARTDVDTLLAAMEILHAEGAPVLLFASWADRPVPRSWPAARAVPVPPLTAAEVAVLTSQWLGVASVSPELVRRLLLASGGMPTPLQQLVRSLSHGNDNRSSALAVPASVRDALLVRLESLSRLHRRVAEAVSLAEGDLVLAQLAHAVDETEADTTAALDALVADQLLAEQEGRWTFRVGLAGALVRERLRPTRRHVLCRRISDTVLYTAPSPRLASVLLEAGRVEQAADIAVGWAAPLARAGLHAQALPLLERVATARGSPQADSPLWRLYAECLAEVRPEGAAADHAVGRARALAATVGERGDADLAAARLARARGDTSGEREVLLRAVDQSGRAGDRMGAANAAERLAELDLLTGDLDAARRHIGTAVLRLRGPDGCRASVLRAQISATAGELRTAEAILVEAASSEEIDELATWQAAAAFAAVLRPQGRFSEARARIEALLPHARVHAPAPVFAALLLAAAEVDIDLYRIGQARDRLAQAMDAVGQGGPPTLHTTAAVLSARLAWLADEEQNVLHVLDPVLQRATDRQLVLLSSRLEGIRALDLLRSGQHDEGEAQLKGARAALSSIGAFPMLAELAIGRAELADGQVHASVLFADVAAWMEMQPARVLRLEFLLAAMRHADRHADRQTAERYRQDAEAVFGQIRKLLSPEDDTSLGVHPWRQALRWG